MRERVVVRGDAGPHRRCWRDVRRCLRAGAWRRGDLSRRGAEAFLGRRMQSWRPELTERRDVLGRGGAAAAETMELSFALGRREGPSGTPATLRTGGLRTARRCGVKAKAGVAPEGSSLGSDTKGGRWQGSARSERRLRATGRTAAARVDATTCTFGWMWRRRSRVHGSRWRSSDCRG